MRAVPVPPMVAGGSGVKSSTRNRLPAGREFSSSASSKISVSWSASTVARTGSGAAATGVALVIRSPSRDATSLPAASLSEYRAPASSFL